MTLSKSKGFAGVMLVALGALVVGALHVASAHAANSVYSFVARGIITDVDQANKTIKVDVTKVDGKGKADLEGNNTEFVLTSTTKVLRVMNGRDKGVTYKNLAIGQEVGFKGVKKDDDTYVLSFVRIHERLFQVLGLLEEMDTAAKTVKISVISSTYKPKTYPKGTEITMSYNDDTKFRNASTAISIGDVNADAQKVKVWGYIENSNTWKVITLWDKYKGSN